MTSSLRLQDGVTAGATFSDDPMQEYRYTLTREWSRAPLCAWVMLNPSTATAEEDDPTIRRCQSFARAWGFGGILVVNLFAYRATNPSALRYPRDPIGPENNETLSAVFADVEHVQRVMVGWGVNGRLHHRDLRVLALAREAGRGLHALGVTKQGHPKHPLYVRGDTQPQPFRGTK